MILGVALFRDGKLISHTIAAMASAALYAWRHSRSAGKTQPILIEFSGRDEEIVVDGRDLLYTTVHWVRARDVAEELRKLCGEAIRVDLDAAAEMASFTRRIASVDLVPGSGGGARPRRRTVPKPREDSRAPSPVSLERCENIDRF
ncbi:hypothetical protein [Acidisphaera sp. S103]|uniref:hypothetical protein n=1 Tax=Acidisphaera sp. S103 TaxID=1747223 RepID=UPI00131E9BC7|nr:hypothetical protein [Acidisphaera sp. S103]